MHDRASRCPRRLRLPGRLRRRNGSRRSARPTGCGLSSGGCCPGTPPDNRRGRGAAVAPCAPRPGRWERRNFPRSCSAHRKHTFRPGRFYPRRSRSCRRPGNYTSLCVLRHPLRSSWTHDDANPASNKPKAKILNFISLYVFRLKEERERSRGTPGSSPVKKLSIAKIRIRR